MGQEKEIHRALSFLILLTDVICQNDLISILSKYAYQRIRDKQD